MNGNFEKYVGAQPFEPAEFVRECFGQSINRVEMEDGSVVKLSDRLNGYKVQSFAELAQQGPALKLGDSELFKELEPLEKRLSQLLTLSKKTHSVLSKEYEVVRLNKAEGFNSYREFYSKKDRRVAQMEKTYGTLDNRVRTISSSVSEVANFLESMDKKRKVAEKSISIIELLIGFSSEEVGDWLDDISTQTQPAYIKALFHPSHDDSSDEDVPESGNQKLFRICETIGDILEILSGSEETNDMIKLASANVARFKEEILIPELLDLVLVEVQNPRSDTLLGAAESFRQIKEEEWFSMLYERISSEFLFRIALNSFPGLERVPREGGASLPHIYSKKLDEIISDEVPALKKIPFTPNLPFRVSKRSNGESKSSFLVFKLLQDTQRRFSHFLKEQSFELKFLKFRNMTKMMEQILSDSFYYIQIILQNFLDKHTSDESTLDLIYRAIQTVKSYKESLDNSLPTIWSKENEEMVFDTDGLFFSIFDVYREHYIDQELKLLASVRPTGFAWLTEGLDKERENYESYKPRGISAIHDMISYRSLKGRFFNVLPVEDSKVLRYFRRSRLSLSVKGRARSKRISSLGSSLNLQKKESEDEVQRTKKLNPLKTLARMWSSPVAVPPVKFFTTNLDKLKENDLPRQDAAKRMIKLFEEGLVRCEYLSEKNRIEENRLMLYSQYLDTYVFDFLYPYIYQIFLQINVGNKTVVNTSSKVRKNLAESFNSNVLFDAIGAVMNLVELFGSSEVSQDNTTVSLREEKFGFLEERILYTLAAFIGQFERRLQAEYARTKKNEYQNKKKVRDISRITAGVRKSLEYLDSVVKRIRDASLKGNEKPLLLYFSFVYLGNFLEYFLRFNYEGNGKEQMAFDVAYVLEYFLRTIKYPELEEDLKILQKLKVILFLEKKKLKMLEKEEGFGGEVFQQYIKKAT